MSEHKHAEVLRAIADGRIVQFEDGLTKGLWVSASMLGLNSVTPLSHPHLNWRVAPPAWQEAFRQAAREGQVVEFHHDVHGWNPCAINDKTEDYCFPSSVSEKNYRIRPEPKPDVVREVWLHEVDREDYIFAVGRFRLVTDAETGKLKSAEVLS